MFTIRNYLESAQMHLPSSDRINRFFKPDALISEKKQKATKAMLLVAFFLVIKGPNWALFYI